MHSIRTKITAITIVEILVAILLVSLVSFTIVQTENDRQSVEMMSLVARDTRKSLEKYTEDLERAVETFSNLASDKLDNMTLVQYGLTSTSDGKISERTPEQVRQLDAYLAEYMKQLQADSASVASHTQGVTRPSAGAAPPGWGHTRHTSSTRCSSARTWCPYTNRACSSACSAWTFPWKPSPLS